MNLRHNKNYYDSITTTWQRGLTACQSLLMLLTLVSVSTVLSNAHNQLVNNQSATVAGNILRVGPGQPFSRVRDAAAVAVDGDIIEISVGTYSGDAAVATLSVNNLIVRGVGGGRAHLEANGVNAQGKGIWVTTGNNITIENIEFSGASVPDQNGAGIRVEGANLTIRNCYFHDNENGILAANNAQSDLLIENSEFYRNGLQGYGNIHNMYINRVRSFTLRGSFTHGTRSGHNVKSRALKTILLYNRISDEADGTASYSVNLPEGGDNYLIGNLIQKGPNAENGNAAITFGEDNLNASSVHQLTLVNNTIVNDRGAANFVRFDKTPGSALFINNIFAGGGTVSTFGGTVLRNNLVNQDPQFVDRSGYDYRLTANSPAINAGTAPGTVNDTILTPAEQYVYPTSTETRTTSGSAIDIGAFEFASAPPTDRIPNGTYKITAKHSGKALDVRDGLQSNGAFIQQWDYVGGDNQKWVIEALDDGTYKLKALHSGKALDVCGASTDDGACLIQYDNHGGDNQRWRIELVGNGFYRVIAKHSGKALDVSGVSYDNGASVIQWTNYDADNQLWRFESLSTPR